MTTPAPQPSGGRPPVPIAGIATTVALLALPIIEIVLLVLVGNWVGVLPLLLFLLVKAGVGAWLAARQGRKAWQALAEVAASGRTRTGGGGGQLADAALVPLGGLLLVVPGFLTDIVGVLLLVPVTRTFARRLVGWVVNRQVRQRYGVDTGALRARLDPTNTIRGETVDGPAPTWTPSRRPGDDGEVISGEIER